MSTTMKLALAASLMFTGCFDPRIWHGHGDDPGHEGHGCKKRKHGKPCEEMCPSTSHFRNEDGACRRKALTVSAGRGYSCAVLSGGNVKCWGDDGGWRGLGYTPMTSIARCRYA